MNTQATNQKKTVLKGKVVSSTMDKTIVVEIATLKMHPKYRKQYKVTSRFKVHDENNVHKVGDMVEFVMSRPMSKDKRFVVVS